MLKNNGGIGRLFNNCIERKTCPNRGKNCNLHNCTALIEEKCPLLDKPPYVCNSFKKKYQYTLTKHFYDSLYANSEYKDNLIESRTEVIIDKEEVENFNSILVPLICVQRQPIHQAIINNQKKIMYSDKTIYRLIDLEVLNIKNIYLPRKVRYKTRRKNVLYIK